MSTRTERPTGPEAGIELPPGEVWREVAERLSRLEAGLTAVLGRLATERVGDAAYSTAEAAALLGKDEFTVREWCRLGRIHASKKRSGRGRHKAWVIAGGKSSDTGGKGYSLSRRGRAVDVPTPTPVWPPTAVRAELAKLEQQARYFA